MAEQQVRGGGMRRDSPLIDGAPGLPSVHRDCPLHLFCTPPPGLVASRANRALFVHAGAPLQASDRLALLAGFTSPDFAVQANSGARSSTPITDFWRGFLDIDATGHSTPAVLFVSGVTPSSRDSFHGMVANRLREIARVFNCALFWVEGTSSGPTVRARLDSPSTPSARPTS